MLAPVFKKIIQILDTFPEIGPRQAWRLFFWFIKQDKKFQEKFLESFSTIIKELKFCKECYFPTIESDLCNICNDPRREKDKLCIVSKETDLITIENLKKYKGLYFVLGGLILPFEDKKVVIERIKKLKEKLDKNKNIKEIILALPLTKEAEPTKKELEKILSSYNLIIKTPKRGIPTGGEIEFIDPETLKESLEL